MLKPSKVIKAKIPTPTRLSSALLSAIDREIKERAIFSACTTEQRYVAEMQDVLEDFTSGNIGEGEARKRLMESLDDFGYTPEKGFPKADSVDPAQPGTIRDLSSYARLNLVVNTNAGMAASVSRIAEETPETLDLFPAWRLIRFAIPNGEPRDWAARWAAAGDSCGWKGAIRGDFVARKDSPIWQALGDGAGGFEDTLHNPYPPFAFNSGMGWEDVDRDEAESIGLEVDGVTIEKPTIAVKPEEIEKAEEQYGLDFSMSF